jgi:hypothetical protein
MTAQRNKLLSVRANGACWRDLAGQVEQVEMLQPSEVPAAPIAGEPMLSSVVNGVSPDQSNFSTNG